MLLLNSHGTAIRLAYGGIAVAAMAAVALAFQQGAIGAKEIATAVLALLGTFLGATFAFRLNQDKEEKKLHKERRGSLNRAIFVLARQANAIQQLKLGYEQIADSNERAFNLPALKPPGYSDLVHNFVDLEFLLESDDPSILLRLTTVQEMFQQAIESVSIRNNFYINEFQPKIAALGANGSLTSLPELHELLGDRVFSGTINGTSVAYKLICDSDVCISEMRDALIRVAKNIYPGCKFVTYEKAA